MIFFKFVGESEMEEGEERRGGKKRWEQIKSWKEKRMKIELLLMGKRPGVERNREGGEG